MKSAAVWLPLLQKSIRKYPEDKRLRLTYARMLVEQDRMDDAKAEAAIAFVKFMSSAESEAFIADELGLLPGNADAYDLVADNAKVTAWKGALDVAQPRPWIPEGGQFFTAMDEEWINMYTGKTTAQEGADAIAKAWTEFLPDYSD